MPANTLRVNHHDFMLCFGFLNELVWLLYRVLNGPSVCPT